jgi:predicted kinase
MSTVHLLHGLPGTGKTTFARRLKSDCKAVCLSHDEWMVKLYGTNPASANFTEYHDRILSLLWQIAGEFIKRDIDVVLDHGFWTRRSRDEARAMVVSLGATPKLYRLVCPDAVADARVLARAKAGIVDCLRIDEHALRVFHSRYEPLQPDEDHIRISTDSDRQKFE